MTEETLTPIAQPASTETSVPLGRRADRLAMIISGLATLLSIIGAIWFFTGFAENDTRPEHLTSALVLTLILFAFAILPFGLVTVFARRAYKVGTTRTHLLWTVLLMLPWIGLGGLAISHTPLPFWSGLIAGGIAALLCIWAFVSLILDRQKAL